MQSSKLVADIVVIGSLNVDLVSYISRIPAAGETLTSESFSTGCGGKGANQAVATARLIPKSQPRRINPPSQGTQYRVEVDDEPTLQVRMIGAVGDDDFGVKMQNAIVEQGIDSSTVRVVKGEITGVAVILVDSSSGENRILVHPGANATVLPSTLPSSLLNTSPLPYLIVMQLECPLVAVMHTLKQASDYDIPVLLNPAPAVPLDPWVYTAVRVLVVNETEASLLSGIKFPEVLEDGASSSAQAVAIEAKAYEAAEWFVAQGCTNVLVTLGAHGAVFHSAGLAPKRGRVPAQKVKVVDTTAAGDTFIGALAVKLVQYWSAAKRGQTDKGEGDALEDAISYAVRASAWTVARKGTWDAMPLASDLED